MEHFTNTHFKIFEENCKICHTFLFPCEAKKHITREKFIRLKFGQKMI